ncbi:MAG: hypothetical protein WC608_01095 [Parcubacteria group bacterium]
MKKSVGSVLTVVFAVLVFCFSFSGCVGKNYVVHQEKDGLDVYQGGRTGVFGTDNSWAYVIPKKVDTQQVAPAKIKLERSYKKTFDSWEQKCPDPKQRKNFKHENLDETWTEEILNTNLAASSTPFAFGVGNSSTGNNVIPAAAIAGGMMGGAALLRPDRIMGTGKGSGGCDQNGCY